MDLSHSFFSPGRQSNRHGGRRVQGETRQWDVSKWRIWKSEWMLHVFSLRAVITRKASHLKARKLNTWMAASNVAHAEPWNQSPCHILTPASNVPSISHPPDSFAAVLLQHIHLETVDGWDYTNKQENGMGKHWHSFLINHCLYSLEPALNRCKVLLALLLECIWCV